MKRLFFNRPPRLSPLARILAGSAVAAGVLAVPLHLPLASRLALGLAAGVGTMFALGLWQVGRRKALPDYQPTMMHDDGNISLLADAVQDARRDDGSGRAATRPAPLMPSRPPQKTHRDTLTGLRTRACLDDMPDSLMSPLAAQGAQPVALCLELDGLADIESRYGRMAADQVRQQVAKRLRRLARQSDTVIRLDGDRYLLLAASAPADGERLAKAIAARTVEDLQRPLSYRTLSSLRLTCCVGAAVADAPAHDDGRHRPLSFLVQRAEQALQQAQKVGPGQFRFHQPAAA